MGEERAERRETAGSEVGVVVRRVRVRVRVRVSDRGVFVKVKGKRTVCRCKLTTD